MKVSKIRYDFYVQNKIPKLGDFTYKDKVSIHKVINDKVNYDPFQMRKKETERHNKLNLLKLSYNNYKRGLKTKDEFFYTLISNKYIAKYLKRFI